MNTVNITQFLLLLVYVGGVWSWEKVQEPANQVFGRDKECLEDNNLVKNKYMIHDSCKKNGLMKGECDPSLESVNKYTASDGVPCGTLDDNGDESDLSMLGQEVTESSERTEDVVASEERSHQAPETDTLRTLDHSIDVSEEKHSDEIELISKPHDIVPDSVVQDVEQSNGRDEEVVDNLQEATIDGPVTDENVDKGSEREEMDSEQESVPLREILLKLKPEGLTDEDDDEQSSDYSVTEPNLGDDVEVEEEALVSSGSPEKQEQNLYINDTKSTTDVNGANPAGGSKKAVCLEINATTDSVADVEIINATTLLKLLQVDPNVTSRSSTGPCYLIYFFSPYCPFSVVGSPYVNALARSLPNIPIYGLDSIEHHSVNARYGVMGTPTLLLFHNGNGVGRYNASEYSVSQLMSFIRHYTDQELTNINVTSSDFRATLPSQIADVRPYALWAAWIFLLSFASWLFLTSELCARLTEAILNNWREAEAQNDHQD